MIRNIQQVKEEAAAPSKCCEDGDWCFTNSAGDSALMKRDGTFLIETSIDRTLYTLNEDDKTYTSRRVFLKGGKV